MTDEFNLLHAGVAEIRDQAQIYLAGALAFAQTPNAGADAAGCATLSMALLRYADLIADEETTAAAVRDGLCRQQDPDPAAGPKAVCTRLHGHTGDHVTYHGARWPGSKPGTPWEEALKQKPKYLEAVAWVARFETATCSHGDAIRVYLDAGRGEWCSTIGGDRTNPAGWVHLWDGGSGCNDTNPVPRAPEETTADDDVAYHARDKARDAPAAVKLHSRFPMIAGAHFQRSAWKSLGFEVDECYGAVEPAPKIDGSCLRRVLQENGVTRTDDMRATDMLDALLHLADGQGNGAPPKVYALSLREEGMTAIRSLHSSEERAWAAADANNWAQQDCLVSEWTVDE
jgi:hypothetical protein